MAHFAEPQAAAMRSMTIKTGISAEKSPDGKQRTFEGTYDVPTTVQGYLDKFDHKLVLDLLDKALYARVRASIRPELEGDEQGNPVSDEDIQAKITNYNPATPSRRGRVSEAEKYRDALSALDDEARKNLAAASPKFAALIEELFNADEDENETEDTD